MRHVNFIGRRQLTISANDLNGKMQIVFMFLLESNITIFFFHHIFISRMNQYCVDRDLSTHRISGLSLVNRIYQCITHDPSGLSLENRVHQLMHYQLSLGPLIGELNKALPMIHLATQ